VLATAVVFVVALSAQSAFAASVDPVYVTDNPQCSDYGLSGLKADGSNVDGDYSDGTLSVTIDQDGNGGAILSWSSNIGVDKVIVKGGAGSDNSGNPGSNVYSYDPESTGDTNLVPPNNTGLSHVEFCYDTGDTPPPPPQTCEQMHAGEQDSDQDGVVDACDNCTEMANPGQEDSDQDGIGDACEPIPSCAEMHAGDKDSDEDGIVDACDNCPDKANMDQADSDHDGTGDACEATTSTNPPPDTTSTTPPAQALQAPASQQQAPAEEPGGQEVLGERISGGAAKLLSATGCAGKPFSARVRGAGIASVVFTLDGKRVRTLLKPNRKGVYSIRVNPARYRVGVHRLVATVTFKPATRTKPRTLRASFQRCAQRLAAPRFTG